MADNKTPDYSWLVVVAVVAFMFWSCDGASGPCDDLTGTELSRCIDAYDQDFDPPGPVGP